MTYYFDNSGTSAGPFSKEQLRGKISKDTLIWYEGQEGWIMASEIDELKDLFFKIPPPLPKKEDVIKVEALVKKEKKELFTEKRQTKIATEIKFLFFIAVAACIIGLISFVIKQNQLDYYKYSSLASGFQAWDREWNNTITNNIFDNSGNQNSQWWNNNKSRKDSLINLSKDVGCYSEGNYNTSDDKAIISCLEREEDYINDKAFSFAIKVTLISFVVLAIGRYIFFTSKWVATKSN